MRASLEWLDSLVPGGAARTYPDDHALFNPSALTKPGQGKSRAIPRCAPMIWLLLTPCVGATALALVLYFRQMRAAKAISDPFQRMTTEIEILRTTSQLAGGAILICGLLLTWAQFHESRDQFRKSLEGQQANIGIGIKQLALQAATQNAERLARALGNLDSESPTVRAAGILTLLKVGEELPAEYGSVTTSLAVSFVRTEATKPKFATARVAAQVWPPVDLAAALGALARIPPEAKSALDLRSLYLREANLRRFNGHGLHLEHGVFEGADLRGSSFTDAWLSDSNLGHCDLRNADLTRADLARSILAGADLFGSVLVETNFEEADLGGARLSAANLHLARLARADLRGARLVGTVLSGADLSGADLSATSLLTQAQIEQALGTVDTRLPPTLRLPASWQRPHD